MATETSTTQSSGNQPKVQLRAETSIDYDKEEYKYKGYLSHHTPGLQPPLQEFAHEDVGLRADPKKPNLLGAPDAVVDEITPAIGTEIRGIQLSSLSSAQLDELALLAAERGVVIFKDQDFSEAGPERWREYGKHFGPLHVHQMGGQIKDYPEILPVYRDFTYVSPFVLEVFMLTGSSAGAVDNEIKDNITSVKWHSDMSYEM
ncbi:hypothetical protein SLS54_000531 [Diplodia seriata]